MFILITYSKMNHVRILQVIYFEQIHTSSDEWSSMIGLQFWQTKQIEPCII